MDDSGTYSSWRELIAHALAENAETWDDVISVTLSDEELDVRFDVDYGGYSGVTFTAWSNNFVYFSAGDDASQWAGSAPRNPIKVQ